MYHNYPTNRNKNQDLEGGIYDFVKNVGQQMFGTDVDNPNKVNVYQPTQLPPKKTLYDMVWNTYNPNNKRVIPGWTIIQQTPTLIFYLQNNVIVVAIRGSTDWRDVAADVRIALNVLFSSARFTKDLATLQQVQTQYPQTDFTYYGVSHSLGGAILQRLLKMGLIKEGVSYNPAIERSEINDTTTKHYKIYNEDDPLYMLMGKNASNVEVRPNERPSKLQNAGRDILKKFSLGRAVNSLQAHLLGNFEGGMINKHFPINYGLDTDDYLEKAKEYARKSGYQDYASLKYAEDGTHKLILRGVPFGNKNYKDFINYGMTEGKDVALKHRDRYLKRATKIKGEWKDDPYSPNNLAIKILWGGGKATKKPKVSSKPVDWEDIKWGSFTNQFKVWKVRHPEYTHINSLEDFAEMIVGAPQVFKPITVKRARFYLNVLKPQDRAQDLEGSGLIDTFVEFLRKIIGNKTSTPAQPTGSFKSYDSYDKKAWEKRQQGRRDGTYDAFGWKIGEGGGLFDAITSAQNWVLGKALDGVNIAQDFTHQKIVKPIVDKLQEKIDEVRHLPAVQEARQKIILKTKQLLLDYLLKKANSLAGGGPLSDALGTLLRKGPTDENLATLQREGLNKAISTLGPLVIDKVKNMINPPPKKNIEKGVDSFINNPIDSINWLAKNPGQAISDVGKDIGSALGSLFSGRGATDPCWNGYEMIGMKKKGKRQVPNCVPVQV